MHAARRVVGLTTLVVALVLPASAAAQTGDPSAGSPSGVIYEIPLDNARQDAAPTRRAGSGGGSGGGGSGDSQGTAGAGAQNGTVSPIRSENGFGSSSTVPGAATLAAAAAAKKSSSGGDGAGAQGPGGSSGSAPGASAESIRGAGSAAITPSKSRAYMLLLLALLVAAGLGLAGRYVARRR